MFIGILSILSAVILSVISAIFSISGIKTIFSGATLGAMFMAGSMELAKTSATLWLYKHWKQSSKLLKGYLLLAVSILILISSIGIYGYLSKAYVAQSTPLILIQNKIDRIDLSIEREKKTIKQAELTLDLLDQSIQKYIDLGVVTKGLTQRSSQIEERKQLKQEIKQAEDLINSYDNKRLDLINELNSFQANVGPIKYISILIYGEEDSESHYDNSARLFIILLVIVFDPLAVLLMVAGNVSIDNRNKKPRVKRRKVVKPASVISDTSKRMGSDENIKENIILKKEEKEIPPIIHKKRRVVKK